MKRKIILDIEGSDLETIEIFREVLQNYLKTQIDGYLIKNIKMSKIEL